jgi:uncharacterized repeat protein (TIGR03803 family)
LTQSCGTVFELSPPTGQQAQWRERVLWSFGASGDGYFPVAGLIADKWGNLYGTTAAGGPNETIEQCLENEPGCRGGTVFELSPLAGGLTPWRERVLWGFGASDDGTDPQAGLIADKWGNLYGTTELGGANSCVGITCGTVFELSPPDGQQQTQWRERVLWSFGASGDGQFPQAGLIADWWGNLYGTTQGGGTNGLNAGTVFKLSPSLSQQAPWREKVLWSFGADDDGSLPESSLLADEWGNLFGTTIAGGAYNFGTVFELSLY